MKIEDLAKLLAGCNIHVKGDLVMEKHVEHEVANVETGGIGIQIIEDKKQLDSREEKVETSEEEAPEQEVETSEDLQKQDTRQAFLFIEGTPSWEKEGRKRRESVENEAVRNREKARFMEYLNQHKMGKRKIFCDQSDLLNQVTVCFVIRWKEMGLTAPNPSGRAVFRFLREECGLQTEVTIKAYANKMNIWLKQEQYTPQTWREVGMAFSHQI